MKRNQRVLSPAMLVAMGVAVAAPAAVADDAPNQSPSSQTAAAQAGQIQEVIVTAQKRSEDVKEVPTSISVIDAAALAAAHIVNYEDITRSIPGLSFANNGGRGLDNIEIRGISSNSGAATVGIYLDEVPITVKNLFNGAIEPKFFDIDRVEVLRGPQGTLYGASSMGGTIRILSKQPDLDNFGGYASTDLSGTVHGGINYEEQAVVNIPLKPGVAALRVGIDYDSESGYIDNLAPTGQLAQGGTNSDRTTVVRASLLVKPDDTLTITPALFAQRDQIDDTDVFYPSVGLYDQTKLFPERTRNNLFIPSLNVTKDFGWADLTSESSYFWQQFNRKEDATFYNSQYLGYVVIPSDPEFNSFPALGPAVANLPGPEFTRTTTTQMAEEVRLASKPYSETGNPLAWLGGLFVSEQQIHRSDDAYVDGLTSTFVSITGQPPQNFPNFSGGVPFLEDSVDFSATRTEDRQYAAFGDVSYNITPALKAEAGLRYAFARSAYTTYNSGYFAGNSPPVSGNNARFYAATPKFSLTYDISDSATAYASAAKGFRLGGASLYVPTTICASDLASVGLSGAPTSYGSDKLWSYETGAKSRFFDNRLSVNGAVYYIVWNQIQQTISLPTCGYTITTNVGNAESYGTELEVVGKPLPSLTLSARGSLNHATLTSVVAQSVGASEGDKILNSPDWTMTLGAEYNHPVWNDNVGFIRADYDWTGRSRGAFQYNNPDYERPVYSVLNASVGVQLDTWKVSLYGKNILNDTKIIQHPQILFLPEAYTVRPPTIGLQVSTSF